MKEDVSPWCTSVGTPASRGLLAWHVWHVQFIIITLGIGVTAAQWWNRSWYCSRLKTSLKFPNLWIAKILFIYMYILQFCKWFDYEFEFFLFKLIPRYPSLSCKTYSIVLPLFQIQVLRWALLRSLYRTLVVSLLVSPVRWLCLSLD